MTEAESETEHADGKMSEAELAEVFREAPDVQTRINTVKSLLSYGVQQVIESPVLARRPGESEAEHEQRSFDTLALAAFQVFRKRTDGDDAHEMMGYLQGLATSASLARGDRPQTRPSTKRLERLGEVLQGELRFGEDYALVLYSATGTSWKLSTYGALGVVQLEAAAKLVRSEFDEAQNKRMSSAIGRIFSNMLKKKAEAEKAETP